MNKATNLKGNDSHRATPIPATAMEWAKAHGIDPRSPSREAMEQGLRSDLGRRWSGLDAEPFDRQEILLSLADLARDFQKAPGSSANPYDESDNPFGPVPSFDEDETMSPTSFIEDVARRHAFSSGVLVAMLLEARRIQGILPPSRLSWMGSIDPEAFVLLSNVGQPTSYAQTACAISHHQDEVIMGRPLAEPYLAPIVDAILPLLARGVSSTDVGR